MNTKILPQVFRMKQLVSYTSLSRGYIYEKINEGTFPPGHMISPGVRVWKESEIIQWIDNKIGRSGQ